MAVVGKIDIGPVVKDLRSLEPKLEKKILRKACRAGAKVVAEAVRRRAPKLTGQTRKAIKVKAAKRSRRRKGVSVLVQLGAGLYKGTTFYGAFVEFGHKAGSRKLGDRRKQVPGVHFMEEEFKAAEQAATRAAVDEIRKGVAEEMAKR